MEERDDSCEVGAEVEMVAGVALFMLNMRSLKSNVRSVELLVRSDEHEGIDGCVVASVGEDCDMTQHITTNNILRSCDHRTIWCDDGRSDAISVPGTKSEPYNAAVSNVTRC